MELSKNHLNLLQNVATTNGFKHYELEIKSNKSNGEGFSGRIIPITIKNEERSLKIILKRAIVSEHFKEFIREIYTREIYIYEVVLEAFDQFQEQTIGRRVLNHPKFYGKCDGKGKEAIILESMTQHGYKMWDKSVPMDPTHIAAVLREYGKLHAISLGLRERNPGVFSDLISKFKDKDGKHARSFVESIKKDVAVSVRGNKILEEAYWKLIDTGEDFFTKSLAEENEEMVVRHGDCWCNNILFKYEDAHNVSAPTSVCLIDWQLSRVGSPILDLAYFFYVSSPREVLDDHRKYLRIYHDSLSRTLRDMSCDPDRLYPFHTFERQWKKYSKYGVFVAPMIFKILHTTELEEIPDLKDFESGKDFYEQMEKAGNKKLTEEKLRDLLEFMVENDLV